MHARPIVVMLVLGAIMTQLVGCQNDEQALQGLLDRQQEAWVNRDRDAVLSVAEAISERDITGPSGYWYYRLKVQSYQLVGQHEEAYAVLRRHAERFGDRIDVVLAMGYTAEWSHQDGTPHFRRALEMLTERGCENCDSEIVLEYCLTILLEEPISPALRSELRATIERDLQELERQAPELYDVDNLTVDDYLNQALPPDREDLIATGALTWAVSPAAQMLQIPQRPARPPGEIDRWWER